MKTDAKRLTDALGVTFTGSVTFNGPMFDIHDNQHVHIGLSGKEEEDARATRTPEGVPEALTTPDALALKERLAAAGLITDDWQPVGLTGAEKGQMALMIAERLGIGNVWKLFGTLWGLSAGTLRAYYNNALDQLKYDSFQKKLKDALG
ncbi:MAG: hypothetical protein K6B45_09305 [Bacteroidaceae bacterium]|nr:hypothetical protein [Bacteroidaceae bacterium]